MTSVTPDIVPFRSPVRQAELQEHEVEDLQEGTLRLPKEVGVHFPSQRALEIFADHGARTMPMAGLPAR